MISNLNDDLYEVQGADEQFRNQKSKNYSNNSAIYYQNIGNGLRTPVRHTNLSPSPKKRVEFHYDLQDQDSILQSRVKQNYT